MSKMHPLTLAEEQHDLAMTYAEDGAFLSAARCLREMANLFEQHARNVNDALLAARTDREA